MKRYAWAVITVIAGIGFGAIDRPATAGPIDDSYLAGYASAMLDQKFGAASRTVQARDGVVTVSAEDLAGRQDEAVKTLSAIKGVSRVEMVAAAAPGDKPPRARPETGRLPGGFLFVASCSHNVEPQALHFIPQKYASSAG
jgi:hypothetical protein